MATINGGALSLLDHANRLDPNGSIANIVELLEQDNEFVPTMKWVEGNLPTGHKFVSRTGLPSVIRRRFNQGVPSSKSRTAPITETCSMLATRSTLDVKLAELNGNTAAFRASEEAAFLQALVNEVEHGMFYDSTDEEPENFNGLAPRFDSTTGTAGSQIIKHTDSASGSDQTSMWLVGWGENGVFGIFPKGTKVGLDPTDMGEQLIADANGDDYRAYVTDWDWNVGLCVRDFRRVARIANIDTGALNATGASETGLITSMVKAYHRVKRSGVSLKWYCNKTVATYLHLQALHSVRNSTLAIDMSGGKPITTFLGIPIHETDGILDTEAAIS